ncbi:MAG: NADH-quinone oxidoreductase subunit A [Bacteroidia bacterium]|nr:NADH-quinone oxidoreductase subunit A [Bacteroidia bacterium]MDW8088758.1 NADH-quinone oxidoreductase subunit A [Bacteroidia bacterium]
MLEGYLGALVLLGVGVTIGIALVYAPTLLGPRRPLPQKMIPYESGMDPVGTTRQRFSVHYYKVAMLFTIFDVEIALLYPWVLFFRENPAWALGLFVSFTGILAVGYLYLLRTGIFDWSRKEL